LSATGLPDGMTATFDSNPTAGDCDLTIDADSSVPPGAYFVNVAGSGGGQTLTRTITLQVGAVSSTAPPTFSVGTGAYTTPFTVSISDSTPGAIIYYTSDGSTPTTGSSVYSAPISVSASETLRAIATANGYATSTVASAAYTITPTTAAVPLTSSLSPAFTGAGGASFTLTVTGSGFTSSAVVYWGTAALSTQFVSPSQVTAQVPAADIASAGASAVSVQPPAPAGAASNALEFEVDSASGSASSPDFAISTATVSRGQTASYPVTLSASATDVSVTCLNLPAGATCSYSSATGAVTIATTAATPPGTYTVTAVFAQTLPGAVSSLVLFPFLLLPLAGLRRKRSVKMVYLLACLSVALMAGSAVGCVSGGNSPAALSTPNPTHQVTSSGSVSITVE
jgi:Chitobiase/beta-hexosaminidase C-terminal domain